tara:strand:- start:26721 stop:26894 length:174 start_codon:yes stop_codon:yes gene_type:complete
MNTKNLILIITFAVILTVFRTSLETGWWLIFDVIAAYGWVKIIEFISDVLLRLRKDT